jgi:site-specific recombinase XerD
MSPLAPVLQGFFTDKLITQRQASPHTIAAYRDTCRLLLEFASGQVRKQPCQLDIADLDAPLITAFLTHLETGRANAVTTRNARLAAIRSLFRYAALHAPGHAAVISRVLAIPPKRSDRAIVCFLDAGQIDALLAAPGQASWLARRDSALLLVAVQTGLRVSELTGLTTGDVHLGPGAHVRCHGKGRKDRATPLTRQTITVLRAWLAERGGGPGDPLFPARTGRRLSRDAVEHLVSKHAAAAAARCPAITGKNVTPHTLRHSAAMAQFARRRGHLGHRAMDGTRGSFVHPGLPARRHDHQGKGPRARPAPRHPARPLPRARYPPRVPRHLVTPARRARIMPRPRHTQRPGQHVHVPAGIIPESA